MGNVHRTLARLGTASPWTPPVILGRPLTTVWRRTVKLIRSRSRPDQTPTFTRRGLYARREEFVPFDVDAWSVS
ncbi:hypothetical protein [Streptomyces sp. NPDC057909]|uniref:hypothetical protein n=1 Tax=Streptomyces sp. NPDC057909 TaxID=3346277 RepID=UPI0036E212BC